MKARGVISVVTMDFFTLRLGRPLFGLLPPVGGRKLFSGRRARNPLISPEFAEIFCNFWKRMESFGSLFGNKLKFLEGK